MMSKVLDKIKQIATSEESSWFDEAKERKQNKAWRKRSFQIAGRILIEIRKQKSINGMSQKLLAEIMGVAPQYINKVVKGQENLTLETIAKFEEVLGITLINVNEPEFKPEMESTDFISSGVDYSYHEAYNSNLDFFHKVLLYKQDEEFNSQLEDNFKTILANFNRNGLAEKLYLYCSPVLKNKSVIKEKTFTNYFYKTIKDMWEGKMNELPTNKINQTIRIVWKPDEPDEKSWVNLTNIMYSDKNEFEYEG